MCKKKSQIYFTLAFQKLSSVLGNRKISSETRKGVLSYCIISVLLHSVSAVIFSRMERRLQTIVVCFMKKECKVNMGKMNSFMFLYINSMSKQSLSLPHIKENKKKIWQMKETNVIRNRGLMKKKE